MPPPARLGALVSFDPNLRFPLWPDREALYRTVWEFLPQADVLKVSDEELEFLTGTTDIEKALPKLFTGHVQLVVYTCGSSGAHAYTRTAHGFAPCRKSGLWTPPAQATASSARFCGSWNVTA